MSRMRLPRSVYDTTSKRPQALVAASNPALGGGPAMVGSPAHFVPLPRTNSPRWCSQNYVCDIVDVLVRAEILLRIAREFGRTMEWLLTGEDRP
jgi:hypothetical protein